MHFFQSPARQTGMADVADHRFHTASRAEGGVVALNPFADFGVPEDREAMKTATNFAGRE